MNTLNLTSVDTVRTFSGLAKRIYLIYKIDAEQSVEVNVPKVAFLKGLESLVSETPMQAVFNESDRSVCLGTVTLAS